MRNRIPIRCASALALLMLCGCASVTAPVAPVRLVVAGPILEPAQTASPSLYTVPRASGNAWEASAMAQGWSMLGREDRAAAGATGGVSEYTPADCEADPGTPAGWDAIVDYIAGRAADHRVVIINESHVVTRHRETTRRLLAKLRPLGFTVLAAETFSHAPDGKSPVEQQPGRAWPHVNDGYYSMEPAFGRLLREAKALGYRFAPYEQIYDPSEPRETDPAKSIAGREAAQAQYLAEILRRMRPDERLVVHVGYSHASEVPIGRAGEETEWMASRLRALTGIDPLTIAQTACRQSGGSPVLAAPPASVRAGQFDLILAHPVDSFADHRPLWRREAGDIPTAIPRSLRPTRDPLVIEAFAWDEPFEAVPVDRVLVEPGEEVPLLLPPGRYRVRAVRVGEL